MEKGAAMKPQEESIRELLKGLEGLELLGQWELALVRDLRVKAQALLEEARKDMPDGGETETPPQ